MTHLYSKEETLLFTTTLRSHFKYSDEDIRILLDNPNHTTHRNEASLFGRLISNGVIPNRCRTFARDLTLHPKFDPNALDRKLPHIAWCIMRNQEFGLMYLLAHPKINLNITLRMDALSIYIKDVHEYSSAIRYKMESFRMMKWTPVRLAACYQWSFFDSMIISGRDMSSLNGFTIPLLHFERKEGSHAQCARYITKVRTSLPGTRHSLRRMGSCTCEGIPCRNMQCRKYSRNAVCTELFALVVFLCDNLLQIHTRIKQKNDPMIRWLKMMLRLPMELQLEVCCRAYDTLQGVVRTSDSDAAFDYLIKHVYGELRSQ